MTLGVSFPVGQDDKHRQVHSAACFPILGIGNPSIAPNGKENEMLGRKTHSSETVKSKHMFKANNTGAVSGNGRTTISQGWETAAEIQAGYKV